MRELQPPHSLGPSAPLLRPFTCFSLPAPPRSLAPLSPLSPPLPPPGQPATHPRPSLPCPPSLPLPPQVNPHVVALLNSHKGEAYSVFRAISSALSTDMLYRLRTLGKLRLLPAMYGPDLTAAATQRYTGDVTIVPRLGGPTALLRVVQNPNERMMVDYIAGGQLATFARLSHVKHLLALEQELKHGFAAVLEAQEAEEAEEAQEALSPQAAQGVQGVKGAQGSSQRAQAAPAAAAAQAPPLRRATVSFLSRASRFTASPSSGGGRAPQSPATGTACDATDLSAFGGRLSPLERLRGRSPTSLSSAPSPSALTPPPADGLWPPPLSPSHSGGGASDGEAGADPPTRLLHTTMRPSEARTSDLLTPECADGAADGDAFTAAAVTAGRDPRRPRTASDQILLSRSMAHTKALQQLSKDKEALHEALAEAEGALRQSEARRRHAERTARSLERALTALRDSAAAALGNVLPASDSHAAARPTPRLSEGEAVEDQDVTIARLDNRHGGAAAVEPEAAA